jgi:hypothetical protein
MQMKFGQVLKDACRDIPLKPQSWYQTWSLAAFVLCAEARGINALPDTVRKSA